MLSETLQLESLRQKIEDAEYEAGNQSDYLDRGNPNPAQAKRAREMIEDLTRQSQALRAELQQLVDTVRAQQPQAVEEWVTFHTTILQKIVDEQATDSMAGTRRNVAKNTLEQWEKVRAGQQTHVNINWYFLKDYKEQVRKIGQPLQQGGRDQAQKVSQTTRKKSKPWWQFWK